MIWLRPRRQNIFCARLIAFDGTAYKVLLNDIAAAYDGKEIFAETYEKIFCGLDVESLPIPDLEATGTAFENFSYIFDADYSNLRDFCKKNNINASALTCGAFGYLLGTYTAQNDRTD